jgi:ADP-heptose:LPS heptosyltransferase
VTGEARARTADRPRILLLRALGLGDFLTGVPAYRAVRRAFPGHEIVLAAPGKWAPLAALTGALDRLLPTAELCPPDWPHPSPDLAIDLHGKGQRSHRLLTALRPRRLIAFADSAPGSEGPTWLPDEHEVHRWCRLLSESGVPADPDDLDLERPPLRYAAGDNPPADSPILIHPGAASPSRRWPPGRFARVAAHLSRTGRPALITGDQSERALAQGVAQAAGLPAHAVVAGETPTLAFAELVARSALVVSGDTGIAHLATAFRRPSVVMFGPISPSEWGPPANRPWHAALWNATPGYRGDPHGDTLDPALATISVDQVLAACDAVLGNTGASAGRGLAAGVIDT